MRADVTLECLGLIGDGIHDAPPEFQTADLRLHFLRRAAEEEFLEDGRGFFFARNQRAGARP
jgi:hypothetical protein